MPRSREFDYDEVLERSMQLFWARGYEATSLADLTQAMGISKSSLYETFGSKHALFQAALARYGDRVSRDLVAALAEARPAVPAIRRLFTRIAEAEAADPARRGCLICNAAVEMAPHNDESSRAVVDCLAHLEAAFHNALARARAAGEIAENANPTALARYLTSSLMGLHVVAKARPDRAYLADIVDTTLAILEP